MVQKNGQKTRVKICLENYKEIMANPKFIYQGKEKNYQELQDIAKNKKETVLKEKNYNMKKFIKKYFLLLILCIILILISSLTESFLVPSLLKLVIKLFI